MTREALTIAVRLMRPDIGPIPPNIVWDCTQGNEFPGDTYACEGTPATFWFAPMPADQIYGRRGIGWCDDCIKKQLGLV